MHQLPLARIKKVMKADPEVKMISAEAPILFAKGCDIFITELTMRAWIHAEENKRRTLQRSDIASALSKSDMFDFLIDIVPREEATHPKRSGGGGGASSSAAAAVPSHQQQQATVSQQPQPQAPQPQQHSLPQTSEYLPHPAMPQEADRYAASNMYTGGVAQPQGGYATGNLYGDTGLDNMYAYTSMPTQSVCIRPALCNPAAVLICRERTG